MPPAHGSVRSPARDALQAALRASGIETLIHYPVAISRQPALASAQPARCPIAERVSAEIFSLPLYPALPADAIARVTAVLAAA